jgi:type II secretory pathway pseudopilin PulG
VKTRRGFTIAETLVVAVILGMMLTAICGAIVPLFSAPSRAQAKTDTLGPATAGLYVMQRDIRESDAKGVFSCSAPPVECGDGGIALPTAAIAIPTALGSADLGASFTTKDGLPSWLGFMVYWQPTSGGVVYRTFEPKPEIDIPLNDSEPHRAELSAYAAQAVDAAMTSAAPAIAMRDVGSMFGAVDFAARGVSLQIVAVGAVGGQGNTTILNTEMFTRN